MEKEASRPKAQVKLLKEQAYEIIKEGIITSYYKPGDELREASLSEEIGMSKTPIREALIQLQNEGFVEIRPFKGAIVTDISIKDVVKLYEFRQVIDTYAVKIAINNFTQVDLEYLNKQIRLMEEALKSGNATQYDQAHNNFHNVITSKVENIWINRALASMEDYIKRVRNSVIKNEPVNFINDYVLLLEAIKLKDTEQAAGLIEKHLHKVVEIYKKSKS